MHACSKHASTQARAQPPRCRPPDGLLQRHLPERAPHHRAAASSASAAATDRLGAARRRLLAQLLDELEAEAAPRALIAVDGGAEEHEVRSQHRLDKRKRNGRGLVNDKQLRLRQLACVLRLDVLHCLRGE